ncbi:membrane protein [Alphaproteobacteria bacterium]|nr:membrane protein [Alphaproteobacteria bacterium]
MQTIILLILSNIFMTFAWYGHLKFREVALWQVILISWLIALPEYALQVPANRIGYQKFSAIQLKTMQEVISLIVFCGFSILYLHEKLRWNHLIAFVLIVIATFLVFKK